MQSVPVSTNVVGSNPANCEMYSMQYDVIKFISDLHQVSGFLHGKTDCHNIAEILLKVALNTVILTHLQTMNYVGQRWLQTV